MIKSYTDFPELVREEQERISSLRPGQLVTSYYSGLHRIIAIHETQYFEAKQYCVTHKQEYTRDFKPIKTQKLKQVDASYCHPFTQKDIDAEIEKLKNIKL